MSFWANKVGVASPASPPPAPAPNRPWWAPGVPAQPSQQALVQAPVQPAVQHQPVSVDPSGESDIGTLLRQDGYTTEKAKSAEEGASCPDCGSPNYMGVPGVPSAMKQCFNCGFNGRFGHSTAGATAIGQKNVAPPKPARVQRLTESNYNPKTIVARIS